MNFGFSQPVPFWSNRQELLLLKGNEPWLSWTDSSCSASILLELTSFCSPRFIHPCQQTHTQRELPISWFEHISTVGVFEGDVESIFILQNDAWQMLLRITKILISCLRESWHILTSERPLLWNFVKKTQKIFIKPFQPRSWRPSAGLGGARLSGSSG